MGKAPAFQFYPGDWIQDTRILTPVTRGIWIDMLCFMWRSDARGSLSGTIDQLARMLSCNASEITHAVHELSVTKIADVTEGNDFVTVTNRRMSREEKVRKQTLSRVQKFRNANEKRECNAPVTPPSSSSSSKKKNNKKKSPETTFTIPPWIKTETWAAFMEIRKKKRAPNTDHALSLIVDHLVSIRDRGAGEPDDVLKRSIERGYTGVFDIPENERKPRGATW